jgi:hypothetical protein
MPGQPPGLVARVLAAGLTERPRQYAVTALCASLGFLRLPRLNRERYEH